MQDYARGGLVTVGYYSQARLKGWIKGWIAILSGLLWVTALKHVSEGRIEGWIAIVSDQVHDITQADTRVVSKPNALP